MSKLRAIVDRTYEAFNARDFDKYRELLDEDVELVVSGSHVRGVAAVTEFLAATARAAPGLRIELQRDFVEAGDTLVAELRRTDDAPASSVEMDGAVAGSACGVYRVTGGRIVEWRVYFDPAGEELASAALALVAAEQSALRRVAELLARQAPPEQVFALVTEEVSRVLQVSTVRTVRFEPDGSATVLAAHGISEDRIPPGTNVSIPDGTLIEKVFRTGRPARLDDYDRVQGPIGTILREEGARSGVGGPIVVDGRLWGALVVGSQTAQALPSGTEHRVARFAGLVSTAISNIESRAEVERLAAEQSALRRVAELVARLAPSQEVFALVTEELSSLLDVDQVRTFRFEPDGTATVLASRGSAADRLGPGTNLTLPRGSVVEKVFSTRSPVRVDGYPDLLGSAGDFVRQEGVRSSAAGPIVVDGRLWGAMAIGTTTVDRLPPGAEERVTQFAELVSTAISNIESHAKVARLAAEKSALRRIATLVARDHSPDEVFATLAEELGVLLEVNAAAILRYEPEAGASVVSGWSDGAITLPIGKRFQLAGENLASEVQRTGAPHRKEDYSDAPGEIAATVRELGISSASASPIIVEGATWGVIAVLSLEPDALPPDTEARIAEFSRQAAMAVANANSRSDLARSRARIVQAGDEARRRVERDLHDGAQQRLVSLALELRAAEGTVPSELADLRGVLSRVANGLREVVEDLRGLSRGLHPAVLSEGGLGPALRALARRSAIPVDLRLDLGEKRLEQPVEVAAYYVASEVLTNTAKHANASRADLFGSLYDGWLELVVRDDGRGGADASGGSGLTGLVDRVEAIGGTIQIDSPRGAGTAVRVKLPA